MFPLTRINNSNPPPPQSSPPVVFYNYIPKLAGWVVKLLQRGTFCSGEVENKIDPLFFRVSGVILGYESHIWEDRQAMLGIFHIKKNWSNPEQDKLTTFRLRLGKVDRDTLCRVIPEMTLTDFPISIPSESIWFLTSLTRIYHVKLMTLMRDELMAVMSWWQ